MKVLFYLSQFNTGGGEMSTLRLLNQLQARGAQVTLLLTERGGALENRLDASIRVVHLRLGKRSSNIAIRVLRSGLGVLAALRMWFESFDVAVVGMTGAQTWIVRYVVRAPRKFHFIRNDLSKMDRTNQITTRIRRNTAVFSGFVCVSNVARKSLVAAVPEAADKSHVIYNVLNSEDMRASSRLGPSPFHPRRESVLRVISVCRLQDRSKALFRMVRVARRLVDAGLRFDWYVLGDGPDRSRMQDEIAQLGVEKHMHLLGRIDNPFPAFANADLVAMLSHYEGLCGVINEAKVMGRAVVATRVSGVEEQLIPGETGLIAEQDEEAIFHAMHLVLSDAELRKRLTNDRLPAAILDDAAKLDALWALFQGHTNVTKFAVPRAKP